MRRPCEFDGMVNGVRGRGGGHAVEKLVVFAGRLNWFEPLQERTCIFGRAVTKRMPPAPTGAWLRRAEIYRKTGGGLSIS